MCGGLLVCFQPTATPPSTTDSGSKILVGRINESLIRSFFPPTLLGQAPSQQSEHRPSTHAGLSSPTGSSSTTSLSGGTESKKTSPQKSNSDKSRSLMLVCGSDDFEDA